ncbi:MAG: hypothetical protein J3Q66DRAFT_409002 [Benniella sp.]|nr:MAG: hypothetical protein J3Q66DRAFT_409002 [Benniella sp.]
MPKRPLDQEDAAQEDCYQGEHQGYDRNVRSKKRGSMDDDDVASMLLATELFGDSPSKSQWSSVHFLVKMRLAPSLTLQSFLAHMQEQHPEVAKPALASIWRRFKDFFVADNLEHAVLKDLVDISGMVSAFGAASYIEVEPVTTHPCDPIAQPSPSAPLPAPLVDNARSLLSPSSSSSSSAAAPAAPHPVGTITQPSPSSSSSSSAPAAPHPVGTSPSRHRHHHRRRQHQHQHQQHRTQLAPSPNRIVSTVSATTITTCYNVSLLSSISFVEGSKDQWGQQ